MELPRTLQEACIYFSDADRAFAYAKALRWADGAVSCPRCGSEKHSFIKTRRIWMCSGCKKQFSLKVGTIFEDSAIGLDKWMVAFWMMVNCKNGVSSYEMARTVGVTQKSAWFMLHRIREVMGEENKRGGKIGGSPKNPVQVDETFIGGNPLKMHKDRRVRIFAEGEKKAIVMGMLASQTREVRAMVIPNVKRETLQNKILENVGWGAHLHTDEHVGYQGVDSTHLFVHKTVNHVKQHVNGKVHTQAIENFWACLKRSLKGTYVAVEPFHLDRYVDEQVFRFNNSTKHKMTDLRRFQKAMSSVFGHRLTYNNDERIFIMERAILWLRATDWYAFKIDPKAMNDVSLDFGRIDPVSS